MTHTLALSDYDIFLGPLDRTLPGWLADRKYTDIFLLTDENTNRLCRPKMNIPVGRTCVVGADISADERNGPGTEQFKTLQSCERIWEAMFEAGLDRKALVINLGGGVIGDMGGFCAATYKRGVDFIQVPTTLLAMTDAAIGGKLGIDFQGIKNAVGVFRNPAAVFVDPVFLETLPARELRSGFAEVLKHALIGDPDLWTRLRQGPAFTEAGENRTPDWLSILQASIAVKVRVVEQDPLEKGIRALLNFGHTIGHAVESYFLLSDTPLTHGEAVAIGMICESYEPDTVPSESHKAMEQMILNLFGHRHLPEPAFAALWDLMRQDKKNTSGTVRMAVPDVEPYSMRLHALSADEAGRRMRHYNSLV